MLRVVDAFVGIGGFTCGALEAGCEVVCGVDNEDHVLRSWAANSHAQAVCATIGTDEVPWPEAAPDLHVHFSPPCTALSKARSRAPHAEVEGGLDMLRFSLELILEKGYANWSLENVATVSTKTLLESYRSRHPDKIAYTILDCADFGVPQTRVRLVASTPNTIRLLKQQPVRRASVKDAFAGCALPSQHIKSNTTNRDGTPCVRSVQEPAFCVTASHPLTWCTQNGTTVRCLTPRESATIQSFPKHWQLPKGSRAGIRSVGNAIPPPLAGAIVRCATHAAGLAVPSRDQLCPTQAPAPHATAKRKRAGGDRVRALERRVAQLEVLICEISH